MDSWLFPAISCHGSQLFVNSFRDCEDFNPSSLYLLDGGPNSAQVVHDEVAISTLITMSPSKLEWHKNLTVCVIYFVIEQNMVPRIGR